MQDISFDDGKKREEVLIGAFLHALVHVQKIVEETMYILHGEYRRDVYQIWMNLAKQKEDLVWKD